MSILQQYYAFSAASLLICAFGKKTKNTRVCAYNISHPRAIRIQGNMFLIKNKRALFLFFQTCSLLTRVNNSNMLLSLKRKFWSGLQLATT